MSAHWDTLRALLYDPPSRRAWEMIRGLIDAWPSSESPSLAIDYALEHLESWPDALRLVTALPETPTPSWALVRALSLSICSDATMALIKTHLPGGQLRWLDMDNVYASDAQLRSATKAGCFSALTHFKPGSDMIVFLTVMRSPSFGPLTSLDLSEDHTGSLTRRLAEDISLPHLHTLTLPRNGVDNRLLAMLGRTGHLPELRNLRLEFNEIGAEGAHILASSPAFTRLERLYVGYCRLGSRGLRALVKQPCFHTLHTLDVANNKINKIGIKALVESPIATELRALDLSYNPLQRAAVETLAQTHAFKNLDALTLTRIEHIGSTPGIWAMASRARVKHLSMASCKLTTPDIIAMAKHPWPALTHLDLTASKIGKEAWWALGKHDEIKLDTLDLNDSPLHEGRAEALGLAPMIKTLTTLNLANTRLTTPDLEHILADQPLRRLDLALNDLDEGACRHIAASPCFETLEHLDLTNTEGLWETCGRALLEGRIAHRLDVLEPAFRDTIGLEAIQSHVLPLPLRRRAVSKLSDPDMLMLSEAMGIGHDVLPPDTPGLPWARDDALREWLARALT